jgi:hypothetical protein
MKINEAFKVVTTRPLNALNKVSIADVAQFTVFDPTSSVTKVAAAFDTIYGEWSYEVDHFHDLNHLDFNKAVVWFNDGSSLTFKQKAK